MKKIIKIIIALLITIIISTLIGIALYFIIADIESKPTPQVKITCNIKEYKYYNRTIFVLKPKDGVRNDNVILYFHGGAYMAEMSEDHWNFIQELIEDSGSTVILPDYPLTPKYNYQDVYNMVVPLYKEIIKKVDTNKLIVMGDSAGGAIGLALCEKIGEEDINQPQKLILISPWLDVRLENENIIKVEKKDKQLSKEALKLAGIAYIGNGDKNSYLVNPINGPLNKLKNIIIYTGTNDILNPDVHVLIKKATNQNINIELKEYEEKQHIWMILDTQRKNDLAYQDIIKNIKENIYE